MIRNISSSSQRILALSVSGTILAADIVGAIADWQNEQKIKIADRFCVMIRVETDFDGYDAEIVHAMTQKPLHEQVLRLALMVPDDYSPMVLAELHHSYGGNFQRFATCQMLAAERWLADALRQVHGHSMPQEVLEAGAQTE